VTPGGGWVGRSAGRPGAADAVGGVPGSWAPARTGVDIATRQRPKRHAATTKSLVSTLWSFPCRLIGSDPAFYAWWGQASLPGSVLPRLTSCLAWHAWITWKDW